MLGAREGDAHSQEDTEEKDPKAQERHRRKPGPPRRFSRGCLGLPVVTHKPSQEQGEQESEKSLRSATFCLLSSGEPPPLFSFFQSLDSK